jgi:PadR family transcriptional regulator AphA
MSLAHAILGWLHKESMTGYDLKKQFDQGIGYFWPADQMQIYRTLDRLIEQGYASVHEEIQHARPNRKVYTVTESGRAEFRCWLTESQDLPVFRDPLMIQVFFASILSNTEIIQLLEQQRTAHSERLASYQQLGHSPLDTLIGTPGVSRRQILRHLTLEQGLKRERAYLDWLEKAIEVVRSLPE